MQVLVVEDNRTNLMILSRLVSNIDGCEPVSFLDPGPALEHALMNGCDLVLVDYAMPNMNGVQFIKALRHQWKTHDVPVIMVTADSDRAIRQSAIVAGATDFVNKPVDPIELRARVCNLLALRRAHLEERGRSDWLRTEVAKATRTIAEREEDIILRLTKATQYRDGNTGDHIERIAHYSQILAEQLDLGPELVREIFLAAPMHDIGKLAVPDSILKKPGPLTPDERLIMEQHTIHGHEILGNSENPLLRLAATIALSHHERFDGHGYPYGMKGETIPLAARIVAVADVFDALTSERVYKPAWSFDAAKDYLTDQAGSHFDPICVDAFMVCQPKIVALHEQQRRLGLAAA